MRVRRQGLKTVVLSDEPEALDERNLYTYIYTYVYAYRHAYMHRDKPTWLLIKPLFCPPSSPAACSGALLSRAALWQELPTPMPQKATLSQSGLSQMGHLPYNPMPRNGRPGLLQNPKLIRNPTYMYICICRCICT